MSHPSEIARETLQQLVQRKLLPTPENYRKVYWEVAGDAAQSKGPEAAELLVFTLQTVVMPLLGDAPKLLAEMKSLVQAIKEADTVAQMMEVQARLKRLAMDMEVRVQGQLALQQQVRGVLALMLENLSASIGYDQVQHSQIALAKTALEKPWTVRSLEEAEQRLKGLVYKQSRLDVDLDEAKQALRSLLARFVDQLAALADSTSGYHSKLEACAARIAAAKDVTSIGDVLSEVMQETKAMQSNAHLSSQGLNDAREKVDVAEQRVRQLQEDLQKAEQMIRYDALTGCLNRKGLHEMFEKEFPRAVRNGLPLCVGLLDIDDFQKINAILGQQAGDDALSLLARLCRDTLRPQDYVARYGGEEFVLLLPETALDDAVKAIARVQKELAKHSFAYNDNPILITFSAGVAVMDPHGEQPAALLQRAEQAVAQVKLQGKNRVLAVI